MAGDPNFNQGINVGPLVLFHCEGQHLALYLENGKGAIEEAVAIDHTSKCQHLTYLLSTQIAIITYE